MVPQKIPEPRFGDDIIGREDTHAVNLGIRIVLRGEMTADDLIFSEAHLNINSSQHDILL